VSEEERKRGRLSELTRRILDTPNAAVQSNQPAFHRPVARPVEWLTPSSISDWKFRDSPISDRPIHQVVRRCGLPASVCGRRAGIWSGDGEERIANCTRSATPPRHRRRKPAAPAGTLRMPLVTSARFAQWNGQGRVAGRSEARGGEQNRALVTAKSSWLTVNQSRFMFQTADALIDQATDCRTIGCSALRSVMSRR